MHFNGLIVVIELFGFDVVLSILLSVVSLHSFLHHVLMTNLDKSTVDIFLDERLVLFRFLNAHIFNQLEFMVRLFVNCHFKGLDYVLEHHFICYTILLLVSVESFFIFYVHILRFFIQSLLELSFLDISQDCTLFFDRVTVCERKVVHSIHQLGFFVLRGGHLFFEHKHVVGFYKSCHFQFLVFFLMLRFFIHACFLFGKFNVFFLFLESFFQLSFLCFYSLLVDNLPE